MKTGSTGHKDPKREGLNGSFTRGKGLLEPFLAQQRRASQPGWNSGQAGFKMRKVKFGHFELMLNMWGIADK